MLCDHSIAEIAIKMLRKWHLNQAINCHVSRGHFKKNAKLLTSVAYCIANARVYFEFNSFLCEHLFDIKVQ